MMMLDAQSLIAFAAAILSPPLLLKRPFEDLRDASTTMKTTKMPNALRPPTAKNDRVV